MPSRKHSLLRASIATFLKREPRAYLHATGGAKAVIAPVEKVEDRGTRTLTSQKMTAVFVKDTQDIERMDAQGEAKLTKTIATVSRLTSPTRAADNTVRLRGGDPTVWDSRARTKGVELDSDLTNKVFLQSRQDSYDLLQPGTDKWRHAVYES